jgi:predicted AlkP superfamily pyrophosphatase or phosphodiesterase
LRILRVFACRTLLLCLIGACALAQDVTPVIKVDHGPNAAEQRGKPYVILVSLDGFRYDYAQKYGAKNLLAMAERGASAPEGMIPVWPSLTFPNHLSIATGLYPEHHGIVSNKFYDPARKQKYTYVKAGDDGSWYGGVPLWSLAEKQGMRAASMFWPGSEGEIAGERPSYYLAWDSKMDQPKEVDQVLAWLRLPEETRPHFITLYYYQVDHAGHDFGPDAPETIAEVRRLDEMVGRLVDGLKELPLRVDVIVVSDHGMAATQGPFVFLDKWADLKDVTAVNDLLYPPDEGTAQRLYKQLEHASDKFKVYRRKKLPKEFHAGENARLGDPVVVANGPYEIRANKAQLDKPTDEPKKGMHGIEPWRFKQMHASFYAAGPDIRAGVKVEPFENVDLYPLIARILGLKIEKIDGTIEPLKGILKDQQGRAAAAR